MKTTTIDRISTVREALRPFGFTIADLTRRNVDFDILADHIAAGLDVDQFLSALDHGLDVKRFNLRQAGTDCTAYNTGLAMFNEQYAQQQSRRHPMSRSVAAATRGETTGCARVRSPRYHAIQRSLASVGA